MCQTFVLTSDIDRIESRFNVKIDRNTVEIPKNYSVGSQDFSYVITCEKPNFLQSLKFGMTPFYATESLNLINARAEGDKNMKDDPNYTGSKSIFLQKTFQKPMQSQRCIIVADAYYDLKNPKRPYLIYLQNRNRSFAFAGIYDRCEDPMSKEIIESFTIITTTANRMLQSIGVKRMPVILSRSNKLAWIKASNHLSDVLQLLVAYPAEKMNGYPVSEIVNIQG